MGFTNNAALFVNLTNNTALFVNLTNNAALFVNLTNNAALFVGFTNNAALFTNLANIICIVRSTIEYCSCPCDTYIWGVHVWFTVLYAYNFQQQITWHLNNPIAQR